MNKLTSKEIALLRQIVDSEYQDGDPTDHDVWLDYIVNTRSRGGVLTSLQRKGLVKVHIVEMAKSDNRQNGISDSTVAITAAGVAALAA